jgi:hypothetical protein
MEQQSGGGRGRAGTEGGRGTRTKGRGWPVEDSAGAACRRGEGRDVTSTSERAPPHGRKQTRRVDAEAAAGRVGAGGRPAGWGSTTAVRIECVRWIGEVGGLDRSSQWTGGTYLGCEKGRNSGT